MNMKDHGSQKIRLRESETARLSPSTLPQLRAKVSLKAISMTSTRKFQELFHLPAPNSTSKHTMLS